MKTDSQLPQLQQDVLAELKKEASVSVAGAGVEVDAEIALAAQNVLQSMTVLPKDAIKVMVENGWITLSGEVEWEYQKQAAAEAVRYLMGVTGVTDHLVIGPMVSSSDVESDIETALNQGAATNEPIVSVTIQDNEATSSATLNTPTERDLAWRCAWVATGERNDLTLNGTVNTWAERNLDWRCAWVATGEQNVVDTVSQSKSAPEFKL